MLGLETLQVPLAAVGTHVGQRNAVMAEPRDNTILNGQASSNDT